MSSYDKCLEICQKKCDYTGQKDEIILVNNQELQSTMLPTHMKEYCLQNQWEESEFLSNDIFYISDLHLEHQIIKMVNNNATSSEVEHCIKKIAKQLFDSLVYEVKNPYFGDPDYPEATEYCEQSKYRKESSIILFGGDIASDFEIAKFFYKSFISLVRSRSSVFKNIHIYAVLGNHELWSFDNIATCVKKYKNLFDALDILLLNNDIFWFGKTYKTESMNDKDELEYASFRLARNVVICGGLGFASQNNSFNANNGIYFNAINREKEIAEGKKWLKCYNEALKISKKHNLKLIVLTHTPIEDWLPKNQRKENCIYFNGHTHKNNAYFDQESNAYIIANNQIGYYQNNYSFKRINLFLRNNPFDKYGDGYFKIRPSEYYDYNWYMKECISGIKPIIKTLELCSGKLYLVRKNEISGFFIVSDNATYICAGGNVRRIKPTLRIDEINENFEKMVNIYFKSLSPYRKFQENISKNIQQIGGNGRIHGCIIDIDFFNHIMVNPLDGEITYYYSPYLGLIKRYDNLLELLESENHELAENLKAIENDSFNQIVKQEKDSDKLMTNNNENINDFYYFRPKDTVYAISNRLNQLQRLFDKKILRAWDTDLLNGQEQKFLEY